MDVRLSDRLSAVAELVPKGAKLADVGTDHALLPIALVRAGRVASAIATDIAAGPCDAARRNVVQHGLAAAVSVRLGAGLATVQPGEVDTVVIAGMGGGTAVEILRQRPDVVANLRRVVVQPMNASDTLRRYLYEAGHQLVAERVVHEDGRWYEVIAVEVPDPAIPVRVDPAYTPYLQSPSALACAFAVGPLALSDPTSTVLASVTATLAHWQEVHERMGGAKSDDALQRRIQLGRKLQWLQSWLRQAGERGDHCAILES